MISKASSAPINSAYRTLFAAPAVICSEYATDALERLGGRRGGILAIFPAIANSGTLRIWSDPEA